MTNDELIVIILSIYFASNVLPEVFAANMSKYIKHDGADWVISDTNLRPFIYYLKIIYFMPYIFSWIVITLVKRLVKFIIYKETI